MPSKQRMRCDVTPPRLFDLVRQYGGERARTLTEAERATLAAELAAIGYELVADELCTIAVRKKDPPPHPFHGRWPAHFSPGVSGAPKKDAGDAPPRQRRGRPRSKTDANTSGVPSAGVSTPTDIDFVGDGDLSLVD